MSEVAGGMHCGGVLAAFASPEDLTAAIARLHAAGMRTVETYTPESVEPDAHSWIPLLIAVAGVGGTVAGLLMQAYAAAIGYPIDIGGRPSLSWPAFVPIAFEIGVLCAIAAGFFGFLIACRLPTLWAPIDEAEGFAQASRAGYFVCVRSDDPQLRERARRLLAAHGTPVITDLPVGVA
jgi:hypothetical protein